MSSYFHRGARVSCRLHYVTNKMPWLVACVLVTLIYSGGGVTKTSGLEQFWTDDYKIFEQVYGKTSDKDIYGATLPPSLNFAEPKYPEASEKKERYLPNYKTYEKESEDLDPHAYGDKFNFLKPAKAKPATSTFNFVSYNDFKPISKNTDPETYNYLKHLEEAEKERTAFLKGVNTFKPYQNYVGPNPEETDAYKSIQDILEAHEANKGSDEDDNSSSKYLTYREKNKETNSNAGKVRNNKKKPPRKSNEGKPRCLPGRCRKRSAISYRVRSRPYYRRIKHRMRRTLFLTNFIVICVNYLK